MNRAKQIRLDRGIGLAEAARGADVAFPSLKKLEDGDEVNAKVLKAVGDFYEVQPSSLYQPATFEDTERAA